MLSLWDRSEAPGTGPDSGADSEPRAHRYSSACIVEQTGVEGAAALFRTIRRVLKGHLTNAYDSPTACSPLHRRLLSRLDSDVRFCGVTAGSGGEARALRRHSRSRRSSVRTLRPARR